MQRRGAAVRSLRLQGSYQSLDSAEMSDEDGGPPSDSNSMAMAQPLHDFTGYVLLGCFHGSYEQVDCCMAWLAWWPQSCILA